MVTDLFSIIKFKEKLAMLPVTRCKVVPQTVSSKQRVHTINE